MTEMKARKTDKNTLLFIIGTIIIIALVIWVILSFDEDSSKPDKPSNNYLDNENNITFILEKETITLNT